MGGLEEMRRAGREAGVTSITGQCSAEELARIERTSAEGHQRAAMKLWEEADALGYVVHAVEMMGNNGWQAIADEEEAADLIVIEGPKLIRAFRSLAMRLDRAVMVKASDPKPLIPLPGQRSLFDAFTEAS